VISQNPNSGIVVAKGSTVRLVVSKGEQTFKVPDVVGDSEAVATSKLEDAGFKVNVTYEFDEGNGTVMEQSPVPGAQAKKGTTIEILVDGGTAP